MKRDSIMMYLIKNLWTCFLNLRGFMTKWFFIATLLLVVQAVNAEQWVNWLGNQTCDPVQYIEPNTLEELCSHIKDASVKGYQVRAVGNGYSISDIVGTNGYLLNLKHFNQLLAVDVKNKLVRVEVGITMQELNKQLACYDLALSNQAAIDTLTLAGALCTAVHGTGHTGTLSSFVKNIELITADGTIQNLSLTSDPDAFAAARVSLGALGVIYAVTLQCEPLFYLTINHETMDIEILMEKYQTLHETNDFFQFFWNIETGQVMLERWNRCQAFSQNDASIQSKVCYEVLPFYTIDENDKDLFSEVAVSVDALPRILPEIKQLMEKYLAQGAKIENVGVRFVEADENAYLSPAANQAVAYISTQIADKDKFIAFYREFEELMFAYQGRPHWGKFNLLNYEKASNLYGINLTKFIAVKRRLDPQSVFSNDFIDRICEFDN